MDIPEVRYARSGGANIAYTVTGDGPLDLVFVPGFVSNVEAAWEFPDSGDFLRRLAAFSRLIMFDKRGTGLSDPSDGAPSLDQRMDDVRAVMDATGSKRAAFLGLSEGGPMSILMSATYPDEVTHLILMGSAARFSSSSDYPWGSVDYNETYVQKRLARWGQGTFIDFFIPSLARDEEMRKLFGRFERMGASPAMAADLLRACSQIDVRAILPSVNVPTLVIHRERENPRVENGRYLAEHIPGAKYVELPGDDHLPWRGESDRILDEVEQFLTGTRRAAEPDRVLATVMFTDIVDSTKTAGSMGDKKWRELLQRHDTTVRKELARYRGKEVNKAGDGFLATFDRPAAAIQCACSIAGSVNSLGLSVRAGVHTGECEVHGDDISGIAVHIGARVAAEAGPDEVLVSRTVKDLVAGSGLSFADRGSHALKGIEGDWQLFAASA